MSGPGLRRGVFLDRDGTLIEDTGYLGAAAQVRLLPGVADALKALDAAGFVRIVITNQSGIGRGLIRDADYRATADELDRQLAAAGASIDGALHCPHAPDAGCPCRKPGTALHREAIAVFGLDPALSWFVGDHLRDLIPAQELGGKALLVRTGQGDRHMAEAEAIGAVVALDLAAGAAAICRYLDAQ